MRYAKTLGLAVLAVGAMMGFAGGAWGTELTSPAGTKLGVGTKIHASSEGATSITGSPLVTCQKSTVAAEITNPGSATSGSSGPVNTLTFEECGSHTVSVLKPGSLELHSLGKNTGTLTSTDAEVTVLYHFAFLNTTIHCIYKTKNTDVGTLTGSEHGGNATATLDINSASILRTPTDGACGEHSTWEGSYSVSSPDSLYVDPYAEEVPSLTSPKGTTILTGTKIHASSEGATSLTGTINVTCQKSTVEGEITGGSSSVASGPVNTLTFEECGKHTVTVLKPGSLELHSSGKNTGTLTSTGAEVTVLLHSALLGTVHCIYKTSNTDIGTLTGSEHGANTTATLDINSVSMPWVATDGLCEHSTWEGSYSFSSPDSLYID